MRIGMMADLYKPHISGVTNYISINKEFLEQQGHEVFVFTFGAEKYQDDETNIIRSHGMPVFETGVQFNLGFSRQIRNLLRTMDIVHVHHPFISGSLAIRYCRPYNIPVVFTSHTRYDLYAQAYLPVVVDTIGEAALQAYLPVFCRACDLVIAPSSGMRDVLVKIGITNPIEVIPNGVNLEPFQSEHEPLDRANFGLSPNDIVLIYVGRLGIEKNLSFLLRAFSGVAQAYDNVHLLLVGDGPERENLHVLASHLEAGARVSFTGFIPYEKLPSYLGLADAFVTASITEVHPLSVIEAMAAGLPVIGIRSPGISDTIEDGVTGFLADNDDIAAFTAKMVRLVTKHDERRSMGINAAHIVEKYSITNTTNLIIERYTAVIARLSNRKRSLRTRYLNLIQRWVR